MSRGAALAYLVAATALFWGGWTVAGWRWQASVAKLEKDHAKSLADASLEAVTRLQAAAKRNDDLERQLDSQAADIDRLMKEKTDAIRRYATGRACLGAPLVRVLNNSTPNQRDAGDLPEASRQPLPDDAAFATDQDIGEWVANATKQYDTCRGRLQAIADFYATEGVTHEGQPDGNP